MFRTQNRSVPNATISLEVLRFLQGPFGVVRKLIPDIVATLICFLALPVFAYAGHWLTAPHEPPTLVPETPVDFELPASAVVIEQHATAADAFGEAFHLTCCMPSALVRSSNTVNSTCALS